MLARLRTDDPSAIAPEGDGTLSIAVDDATGIIRVLGRGAWAPAYADAHFRELRTIIDRQRARSGRIRALVDLTHGSVQSPATAERIKLGTRGTYRPGDRVAVLVGSSLAKMQLRRVIESELHNFFVSRDAALTWLLARG